MLTLGPVPGRAARSLTSLEVVEKPGLTAEVGHREIFGGTTKLGRRECPVTPQQV
jgi:hypothetical protein